MSLTDIAALKARLVVIENELRRRPVISPLLIISPYTQLIVGSGNVLGTLDGITYKGVKRASPITSVPTMAPASISTTYADGLTAAYNLGTDPNAITGPLAWLCAAGSLTVKNPAGSGSDVVIGPLASPQMKEGTLVASISAFQVPVSGSPGTYAMVYVPTIVSV